jgi:hypothetical protein
VTLCQLIINLGFSTKSEAFIESSVFLVALDKLTYVSSISSLLNCHTPSQNRTFPVLLEELATPFPQFTSKGWKDTLANDLLRDAHSKYDNIINTVSHVCRDLEQRCATVETPLRKAQAEIDVLNTQIEDITREKMELEGTCSMMGREMDEMRRQNESLIHELRCVRGEVEGLQRDSAVVREERDNAAKSFENEREAWVEREEELAMTNRALDDELKETQEVIGKLKDEASLFSCV